MSPVYSFLWKSNHFHVKRFAQVLDLKKSQTATGKWSCMKVDLHTNFEEIFTLVELHRVQKKSTVSDNDLRLKYKAIRIY